MEHIPDVQADHGAPNTFPLTAQQVEDTIRDFIDSISKAARNGSFNICFFILFDADVTWVVRIPIEPVTRNAWAKVVSEVTTIRYIKHNTTIPIPEIHAYGKDTTLVKGASTPFILMEFIQGQQLHTRTVFHAAEHQRRNLYIGLIDTLAQLRKLEFSAAGSLMPNPDNPDDESNPVLGPFLSMTINELERKLERPVSTETFTSVKRFMDLHCHILSQTFQLPVEELDRRQAKMELFALESVSKEIPKHIQLQEVPERPYILAHPDLRCGNIMVDDDFHILGIIDWEFTSTIPQQIYIPPPWITGHDPDTLLMVTGVPRDQIWLEFRRVLEELHKTSSGWTQLCQDWGLLHQDDTQSQDFLLELSPIVQILRHPSSLIDVYYPSIFQRLFGSETRRDAVVNESFEQSKNQAIAEQIELHIQKSERYTEYLRNNNLLIPYERPQQILEFMKRAKALLQAGEARHGKEIEE
ncbi:hypothetical protein MHUMG1_03628 [Metarhizium humberi]|uniref:Aminoglycoside phosphotransferase domain-containing protein n=1 Tax=Metarhizium humberi TaxID=2596975 RepID=A0A9P8MBF3_9HYPO|nr:hypothetical protein MHUMG1_03628 [Metarhizium humberi]